MHARRAQSAFPLRLLGLLWICTALVARPALAQSLVSANGGDADFPLADRGGAATVWYDSADANVVGVAARDFAVDVERVTGVKPAVATGPEALTARAVLVGTLGSSRLIDEVVRRGQLDVRELRGKWETFLIATVNDPLPDLSRALVVVGSDQRGTAFGVYELSRQIGVSPWYWWADVPPKKSPCLFVRAGTVRMGPPSVKYRGIFLNDEDWGLQPWAEHTFEPETGDIGPATYAKIFELMLRLKANTMWPAMHPSTRAFNFYPENKLVADRYAIVMGSSHAEPMLRNNVDEWERDGSGEWNFLSNRENVLRYWEERVAENGRFENVYTIGMRGIHDSGMQGGGTLEERARTLEEIFAEQRSMIERHTGRSADQVPQVFVPYKEVLDIYRSGLRVPEDVTLMWSDDNHGYIRQFSDPDERRRRGGSGVYYHLSYWGRPHDFLWIYSTPPALVWEEMTKAHTYGADGVWIANVGDLKPAEIGMEWFLRLAWDIDAYGPTDAKRFLVEFFTENFGPENAAAIADVMHDYFLLNHVRKPEHMGWTGVYPNTPVQYTELSHWAHGDEARRRLEAFDRLQSRAEAIADRLPPEYHDTYFELVVYPVRGAANMNRRVLYAEMSRYAAIWRLPVANTYAELAREAYAQIQADTETYNNEIAGGKWQRMMVANPRRLPVYGPPSVTEVNVQGEPSLVVRAEGSIVPASPVRGDANLTMDSAPASMLSHAALTEGPDRLPTLNRYTRRNAFIDLFNAGADSVDWQAEASEDWVELSQRQGTFDRHQRMEVGVDYGRAPRGETLEASIAITSGDRTYRLNLPVRNPSADLPPGTYIQENGAISIDAERFGQREPAPEGPARWDVIDGVGYSGGVVGLFPRLIDGPMPLAPGKTAPVLSYPLHVFEGGDVAITFRALPTHEIHDGHELALAYAVDGGEPQTVRFRQGNDEHDPVWQRNVLRGAMIATAKVRLTRGRHTLTVYGVDPSVVLDRIEMTFGEVAPSYLGPRSTRTE
ncbi:MAG: glycosyl hydrolase 115 family protein [Longimicrobiales bacterium]